MAPYVSLLFYLNRPDTPAQILSQISHPQEENSLLPYSSWLQHCTLNSGFPTLQSHPAVPLTSPGASRKP